MHHVIYSVTFKMIIEHLEQFDFMSFIRIFSDNKRAYENTDSRRKFVEVTMTTEQNRAGVWEWFRLKI